MYGLALLHQAIAEKTKLGAAAILAHNMRLTKTLLDGLALHRNTIQILGDYTVDNRASIVVIKDTKNHNGPLGAFLAAAGIVITNRGGTLRVSMHFYNQPEQIGYFLQTVESWLK